MILNANNAFTLSFQSGATESTASLIGIIVAISGNVIISLALNCQKLAHQRIKQEERLAKGSLQVSQNASTQRYARGPSLQLTCARKGAVNAHDRNADNDYLHQGRTRVGASYQIRTTNNDENIEYDRVTGPSHSESPPYPFQLAVNDDIPAFETSALLSAADRSQPSTDSLRSSYGTRVMLPGSDTHLYPSSRFGKQLSSFPLHAPTAVSNAKAKGTTALHDIDLEAVTFTDQSCTGVRYIEAEYGIEVLESREGDYLKSKLWWIGFLLMSLGESGNFISYAFAPASIVAPLGTFALIANCFFAPLMLNERFKKRDLLGVGFSILGAVTVVLSASPSDRRLDPDSLIYAITRRPFVLLGACYAVGIVCLVSISSQKIGRQNVFVDVGACGLFGGFTVLATKAFSSLLTEEWTAIFLEWITYPVLVVLIGTAIGQIRYLNRALRKFDSKVVIPTQFVLFNLSAIIGSAVLYGDFRDASSRQMMTFLYGCISTFIGVYMLAWRSHVQDGDEELGTAQTEQVSLSSRSVGNLHVRSSPVARNRTSKDPPRLVALSSAQLALLRAPEGRQRNGVGDS